MWDYVSVGLCIRRVAIGFGRCVTFERVQWFWTVFKNNSKNILPPFLCFYEFYVIFVYDLIWFSRFFSSESNLVMCFPACSELIFSDLFRLWIRLYWCKFFFLLQGFLDLPYAPPVQSCHISKVPAFRSIWFVLAQLELSQASIFPSWHQ